MKSAPSVAKITVAHAMRIAVPAILGLTVIIYWKATHGAFVWDDLVCLRDQRWMLQDNAWRDFFDHDYCGLPNYFRPLAVVLLLLEMRTFHANPTPMHMVSLAIHVLNCILVWRVALRFSQKAKRSHPMAVCACLSLYALHPALIEPIAWISAQTELTVTFAMLLGVLADVSMKNATWRAVNVSVCFFLAACCKESAIALPFLVVVCDWMTLLPLVNESSASQLRLTIARNWRTYAGMIAAGIVYLGFRDTTLGHLFGTHDVETLPFFARIQEICSLYLTCWRQMIWPMTGLSPVHLLDETEVASFSVNSALGDVAAIGTIAYGLVACWTRRPAGFVIAGVTVLLLPFLHLVPLAFDESWYHDRYLMMPLAFVASSLPTVVGCWPNANQLRALALGAVFVFWLALAVANIHITLPLWSDNISLWQWALRTTPESITARTNLFGAYVETGDPRALDDARNLVEDPIMCAICLLNIAQFASLQHDVELTATALARLDAAGSPGFNASMMATQQLVFGRLMEQQNNMSDAESAYRAAISLSPELPLPRMSLALLLARAGRAQEARFEADSAFERFPTEQRDDRRVEFDRALRETLPTEH